MGWLELREIVKEVDSCLKVVPLTCVFLEHLLGCWEDRERVGTSGSSFVKVLPELLGVVDDPGLWLSQGLDHHVVDIL